MKVLLVGILTLVMSFMCLSGCALFKAGKYEAVSYNLGVASVDVSSDDASYIQLNADKTVEVSIKILTVNIAGEGTWEEGEDNAITMEVSGVTYNATVEGNELVLNVLIGTITFEK